MMYIIGQTACWIYYHIMYRIKVYQRNNTPKFKQFLICSNHTSYHDPVILGISFPCLSHPVGFMAKKELFKIPLFGPLIRSVGAFPVVRGGSDRKALMQAEKALKKKALCVFPEGTRSKTDQLLKGQPGAVMLALNSGVPILPMAIYRPSKKGWRREFHVLIGEAFDPAELFPMENYPDHKQRIREATGYLMERISGLRNDLITIVQEERKTGGR